MPETNRYEKWFRRSRSAAIMLGIVTLMLMSWMVDAAPNAQASLEYGQITLTILTLTLTVLSAAFLGIARAHRPPNRKAWRVVSPASLLWLALLVLAGIACEAPQRYGPVRDLITLTLLGIWIAWPCLALIAKIAESTARALDAKAKSNSPS